MNNRFIVSILTILIASIASPLKAENLSDLNQLLSTKECFNCDLSGSGLVLTNLAGAKLSGANLRQANLSRANLSGADLSGADLSGASLHGANLTNANLIGAKIYGADLRGAYLHNAVVVGVSFDSAYVQGALGLPIYAGTPEQFVRWGMVEATKGNYTLAVESYNKALNLNPDFPFAYLNRGIARYRLGDRRGAVQDTEMAHKIFTAQDYALGIETSSQFLQAIELVNNLNDHQDRQSGVERVLGGIGSVLMKLFF